LKLHGKKILVVEDEEGLRETLKECLELAGAEVFTASNGRVAWEIVRKHSIDALISDFKMPIMDGLELLHLLRESGFNIPFIFLTGFACESHSQMLQAGADAVLDKPFDFKTLRNLVGDVLGLAGPVPTAATKNNRS
jgi:CheY-like chemotaxis protein